MLFNLYRYMLGELYDCCCIMAQFQTMVASQWHCLDIGPRTDSSMTHLVVRGTLFFHVVCKFLVEMKKICRVIINV